MSTTGWIVLAVIVVVVVALVAMVTARRRNNELEVRRSAADAHRDEALERERRAERERAAADAHLAMADDIDPDVDPSDEADEANAPTRSS